MHPDLRKATEREHQVQQEKRRLHDVFTAVQGKIAQAEKDVALAPNRGEFLLMRDRERNLAQVAMRLRELRESTPTNPAAAPPPPPLVANQSQTPRWAFQTQTRRLLQIKRTHYEVLARHAGFRPPPAFHSVTYFWQMWPQTLKISVPTHEAAKLKIASSGDAAHPPLLQAGELPIMKADTLYISRVILLTRSESEDLHPFHGLQMILAGLHVAPLDDAKRVQSQLRQIDVYGGEDDSADGDTGSDESLKRAALRNLKRYSGAQLPANTPLHKFMEVVNHVKGGPVVKRVYFIADLTQLPSDVHVVELHREHTVEVTRQRVVLEETDEEQTVMNPDGTTSTVKKQVQRTVSETVTEARTGPLVRPTPLSLHTLTQSPPREVSFETRLAAHGIAEMMQHKHTLKLLGVLDGLLKRQAMKRKRCEENPAGGDEDAEHLAAKAGRVATLILKESVTTETLDNEALKTFEFFDCPAHSATAPSRVMRAGDLGTSILQMDGSWSLHSVQDMLSAAGLSTDTSQAHYRAVATDVTTTFKKVVSAGGVVNQLLPN
eukprot:TRINITY_DN14674_c0_g1_i7.p1 TRINITY_DN14674_c0_g1~~TRINITY_DN14674_c0_g1_i7.p1  ORF type:complete len:548 (+),score=85.44 TRINITY_DN14674_c0_g1_i7:320-1963(+)